MENSVARENMVNTQIRPNGVRSKVLLEAFLKIPREIFVPFSFQDIAYSESHISFHALQDVSCAPRARRYLTAPAPLARILQYVRQRERVLEIGCGTGYGSAILGHMGMDVVAQEEEEGLFQKAGDLLHACAIDTVKVVLHPLKEGFPEGAPYDVIFIQGSVAHIPPALFGQLREGGRLITYVNAGEDAGFAVLYERHNNLCSRQRLFSGTAPAVPVFEKPSEFQF